MELVTSLLKYCMLLWQARVSPARRKDHHHRLASYWWPVRPRNLDTRAQYSSFVVQTNIIPWFSTSSYLISFQHKVCVLSKEWENANFHLWISNWLDLKLISDHYQETMRGYISIFFIVVFTKGKEKICTANRSKHNHWINTKNLNRQ